MQEIVTTDFAEDCDYLVNVIAFSMMPPVVLVSWYSHFWGILSYMELVLAQYGHRIQGSHDV